MKSVLFGDLFENNNTKKRVSFALIIVLITIFSLTISIEGLPFWAYIIGVFGPIGIWAWLKPHKVFEGCKFFEED